MVLNRIAKSVVKEVRGQHPDYVFTYKGKPVQTINNSSWKRVRKSVGLPQVHVHDDLKHTSGRRLRAAGVSYEDRQDLLGHKSGKDHHALLGGRIGEPDRGGQPGVRGKLPQKSRTGVVEKKGNP